MKKCTTLLIAIAAITYLSGCSLCRYQVMSSAAWGIANGQDGFNML
jgi:hypothetical protein